MAKAFWKKCMVPNCEETVVVMNDQYRKAKCEKHRRQDEIERVMDKCWEKQHAQHDNAKGDK